MPRLPTELGMSVPFWVAFGGALLLWLRACPSVGQQTLPAAVTPPGGEWMSGYEERPTSKRALLQRGGASSIIVKRHGLDAGRRESSRAAVRELLAVGGTFAARLHQVRGQNPFPPRVLMLIGARILAVLTLLMPLAGLAVRVLGPGQGARGRGDRLRPVSICPGHNFLASLLLARPALNALRLARHVTCWS